MANMISKMWDFPSIGGLTYTENALSNEVDYCHYVESIRKEGLFILWQIIGVFCEHCLWPHYPLNSTVPTQLEPVYPVWHEHSVNANNNQERQCQNGDVQDQPSKCPGATGSCGVVWVDFWTPAKKSTGPHFIQAQWHHQVSDSDGCPAPGTTDEKGLKFVNGRMKLQPLALEEISLSHRVGQQSRTTPDHAHAPYWLSSSVAGPKSWSWLPVNHSASRMLTKSLMTTMSPRTATMKATRTFHSTASPFTWVTTWRRWGPSLFTRPKLPNAKDWLRAHGLPMGKLLSWILVITSKR